MPRGREKLPLEDRMTTTLNEFVYTDDGWIIAPDGRRFPAISGGGGAITGNSTADAGLLAAAAIAATVATAGAAAPAAGAALTAGTAAASSARSGDCTSASRTRKTCTPRSG